MIPTTTDRNITIGGIDNAVQFTIATSGKAFRTLIDNLYSDKVLAPVRELITNAVDAHVAAGNPAPFKVIVPTPMDPTFGVRDYGTGMDHDLIVGLYTTLFASSKDTSNEQTGMLGLGSKSPFAYTDSFTVEAFDGVSKRVYMAYIENDVPSLSMVGEIDTGEPQGICVKFPVQTHHTSTFTEAIYKVVRGLDVVPELDGIDVDTEELFKVLREGAGWRLVTGGDHDGPMVRQGGVLYPLDRSVYSEGGFPRYTYNDFGSFVFDVPIGTADVTPSRESLSYDERTRANLIAFVSAAWEDVVRGIREEYEACTSQREHMEWILTLPLSLRDSDELRKEFDPEVMKGNYDLFPTHFKQARALSQDEFLWAKHNPLEFPVTVKNLEPQVRLRASDVKQLLFVLDDGVSPRRRSRMLDWGASHPRKFMIAAGPRQTAVVKRLTALMGLEAEQFVKVADIYDEGPRQTIRTVVKKSELQEALDSGKPWVLKLRNTYFLLNEQGLRFHEAAYEYFEGETGVSTADVVFLTPHQAEKLGVEYSTSLAARFVTEAEALVPMYEREQNVWVVQSALEDAGCTHSRELTKHLGFVSIASQAHVTPVVRRLASNQAQRYNEARTRIIVEATREKYPALFPKALDSTELANYLQQQDNPTITRQEATS